MNKVVSIAPKEHRFKLLSDEARCGYCPLCADCWKYRRRRGLKNIGTFCEEYLKKFIEVEE